LGRNGFVAAGYQLWPPGTYELEEDLSPNGECRGLGIDKFNLRMREGDAKTVIVGLSIRLPATVLTDDISVPEDGMAKVRFWGRDRIGTGRLEGVRYCIAGEALAGGSRPSGGYMNFEPGTIDVEVRLDSCTGALRDTFNFDVAAGEVHSLILGPGTRTGSARESDLDDVYIVHCVDSVDGIAEQPSRCNASYSTRVL
jgi:hypothetical protein